MTMEKKIKIGLLCLIVGIVVISGLWIWSSQKQTLCSSLKQEIEEKIDGLNYCNVDFDCNTTYFGHSSVIVGEKQCYALVNKNADLTETESLIKKYEVIYQKCLHDCMLSYEGLVCVSAGSLSCEKNKCVVKDEFCTAEILEDCDGKKVKVVGVFDTTKGCMGVVKGVLLPEFADKCQETEQYLNRKVEVIGVIGKEYCPPETQCHGGMEIKHIDSIRIVDGPPIENIVPVEELKTNFKDYQEKEVSIWVSEIKTVAEPKDPDDIHCLGSSVRSPECFGIWVLEVSDKGDQIRVLSTKKLKVGSIIKGLFSVSCDFFRKVEHSCEIKDHYCECVVNAPGYDNPIRAELKMEIITDSAYQKLQVP